MAIDRLGSLCRCSALLVILITAMPATAREQLSVASVASVDGGDIPVERFGHSKRRLIWLPAETGLSEADRDQAERLSKLGVEVWLADLFAARFLPLGQSSLDSLPAEDVAALIEAAGEGAREVYLLAPGRGAIPLLRGVRLWQLQGGRPIAGIILLHPKLYVETPDPGEAPRFMPVVEASNQAIYLIQPELSPWRWRLPQILPALEAGGSDVFVQSLPGVRDRFYFRPDATEAEQAMASHLPGLLRLAMGRLRYLQAPRAAASMRTPPQPPLVRKAHELKPYAGDPWPPALKLPALSGGSRDLRALRGQVVLVNFWASWCPPCVHELPSMEGLYQRYRSSGLQVLAVNMAEDESRVREFLASKVEIGFPVLLDRDGDALRGWGVFAFPTSFLIDRQGRIRYALFGAVDWQDEQITRVIETLLKQ